MFYRRTKTPISTKKRKSFGGIKILFICLKIAAIIFCLSVFTIQFIEIFVQYRSKQTNNAISYVNDKSRMSLPHLTLCPKKAFKEKKISINEDIYLKNSFSLNETFHEETLDDIKNGIWNVTETRSEFYGICFTLAYHKEVAAIDTNAKVYVRSNQSFVAHFHEPGEEFWLPVYLFPVEVASTDISNNDGETGSVDLKGIKSVYSMYQIGKNCKFYEDQGTGFVNCAKAKLWREQRNIFKCKTPIGKNLITDTTIPLCTNESTVTESYNNLLSFYTRFGKNEDTMECPKPCKKSVFKITSNHFHKNFPYDDDSPRMLIYVYYESLSYEVTSEVLVYDLPKFWAAVGGSLGLFLGFSCYSVLKDLIIKVEKKYKY